MLGYTYAYTGNVTLFINIIITAVSYSIFIKFFKIHKIGMFNFVASNINFLCEYANVLKKPFITPYEIVKLTKIVNNMRRYTNTEILEI